MEIGRKDATVLFCHFFKFNVKRENEETLRWPWERFFYGTISQKPILLHVS